MRVVVVEVRDGASQFAIEEAAAPELADGQLLVEVTASGLNRGEIKRRAEHAVQGGSGPTRTGSEFAGTIVGVGDGVAAFNVGDRVMGRLPGSNADLVVADARAVAPIPPRLSDIEAAAVPVAYMTAHDALVTNAQLRPGDVVLVAGAAAAVGIAAAHVARSRGASTVIGTTRRADKADRLRLAGFDLVVDGDQTVDAVLEATGGRGADVVIDNVGGPMLQPNLASLALEGRMVSVGRSAEPVGALDLELLATRRLRLIGVTFRTRTPDQALACWRAFVDDMSGALHDGTIRPVVDRVFPIDRLAEAEQYMLTDQHVGKIVLDVTAGR